MTGRGHCEEHGDAAIHISLIASLHSQRRTTFELISVTLIYKNMGNVSYALLIRLALEREYPEAMFRVAFRYKLGLDVEQDLEQARRLLWKAAKSRHGLAMLQLAICFNGGKWGFPADRKRAGYWYLQLFKKWREEAAHGDTAARGLIEAYQIEQIPDPWIRKQLGLPPVQVRAQQS